MVEQMSEFDTFVTEDPAADFLARENAALAALDDEFDFTRTNNGVNQKINENYTNGDSDEYLKLQTNGPNYTNDDDDDSQVISSKILSTSPPQFTEKLVPREEPEKIRKWREEQQRLLEQKDAEEDRKKEELRQQAKRELDEWYARYSEQLEKSKTNNRNAEKEWVAERDTEVPGLEWEKIARMCDFNPKSTRNTKDTSRMRSILLQLKQNPPIGSNSKS